ncbi:hypothetical protein G3578_14795 [Brevibacillus sp. SYP-B805]|uniref:hypothetical protein n=1 Tax=Brevibacillus sp. SYP-B805 TaxID=1578199 RepID=UPI0013ED3E69|nr:hypothetical protein [Brevibacillus sp. SYP-B805]NGQ96429.1 hypothetical protein [Brevibacillus sp. SYP-B805]
MKVIVCYPMKSLVPLFMPAGCEVLAAENESECFQQLQLFPLEAAVLFSESFAMPIWEWVPKLRSQLAGEVPMLIVPLHKDEPFIARIIEEMNLPNIYLLPANQGYSELSGRIGRILGMEDAVPDWSDKREASGSVYALLGYGAAGITTFCVNYPVLLAKQHPDKRVAVIDMNVEKPDLTQYFGLQEHQLSMFRPDLIHTAVAERRNWLGAFKRSESLHNLFYSSATSRWKSYEISTLLRILRRNFDYTYLDWGYCFPETEALQTLLLEVDHPIFFVRADPFSIDSAHRWIRKWQQTKVSPQLLVSHFDGAQMSARRIKEGVPVYGIVPRISDNRVFQSHQSRSILVEEMFPPRTYVNSLRAIAEAERRREEAAI